MNREAVGEGTTVLQAQEAACKALGVESHEAEFEVLQLPEKKLFGLFGGRPARVRAFIKITPAQVAEDYLRKLLKGMGVENIAIAVEEKEDGVVFNLTGDDVGYVIGRRGETMDALQYLTGLVANHVDNSYYRVTINTGNYREKREQTLEALARRMAQRAVKTGRSSPLEPMNPYERRIIHTAVQKVAGAVSWSEGEDPNRHVVIGPDPKLAKNRPYKGRGHASRSGKREGAAGQTGRSDASSEQPVQASQEATRQRPLVQAPKRTYEKVMPAGRPASVPKQKQEAKPAPKTEVPAASLYGKIDPKKEKE